MLVGDVWTLVMCTASEASQCVQLRMFRDSFWVRRSKASSLAARPDVDEEDVHARACCFLTVNGMYISHSPLLQIIVEKAEHGDTDHIKHACLLILLQYNYSIVMYLVRILVFMLQNAEQKEERRNSRKERQ